MTEKNPYIFGFERKVRLAIEENHMLGQSGVLAAVSGGADSVCLLMVLSRLSASMGFTLQAVHVEHGIRGQESLDDCAYVEALCRKLDIPLTVRHIQAVKLARESGRTVEEEARIQRYRIFLETARAAGADRVAVAHNLGDQAETVIWNLVRGSGIRGMAGIRPVRLLDPDKAVYVIRPLLSLSRPEIERYVAELGVSFRTDRTNLDTEITRNRIRLQILPQLEDLNCQAKSHIGETAAQISEAEDFLERLTDKSAQDCIREDRLLLSHFRTQDPVIQKRILRECIRRAIPGGSLKDIGQVHVDDLMRLSGAENGKSVDLPRGVRAVREEGIIRFLSPEASAACARQEKEDCVEIRLPFSGEKRVRFGGLTFTLTCGTAPERLIVPEKRFTKWIAYATMNPNQNRSICFRHRRPGDYLVIGADGGRKKLSDYLIDCKVPRKARDQVVLLAEGSHILWAVGGRISEAVKVKPGDLYVKAECSLEEDHERRSQCIDS